MPTNTRTCNNYITMPINVTIDRQHRLVHASAFDMMGQTREPRIFETVEEACDWLGQRPGI